MPFPIEPVERGHDAYAYLVATVRMGGVADFRTRADVVKNVLEWGIYSERTPTMHLSKRPLLFLAAGSSHFQYASEKLLSKMLDLVRPVLLGQPAGIRAIIMAEALAQPGLISVRGL